jgi:hypothetical protein
MQQRGKHTSVRTGIVSCITRIAGQLELELGESLELAVGRIIEKK